MFKEIVSTQYDFCSTEIPIKQLAQVIHSCSFFVDF